MTAFDQIQSIINQSNQKIGYYIPGKWIGRSEKEVEVDAFAYFRQQIAWIKNNRESKSVNTNKSLVYNLFIRLFSAWDHDRDGQIGGNKNDLTLNKSGVRETGTFLKSMALLPYLKNFGITHIHLLPVTKVGVSGKKGNLGSPYAIKNPFEIEPSLADPLLPVNADMQLLAFVEACHWLGIKVVFEFILRTAALDSDLIALRPEWFYWIKEDKFSSFGPPHFEKDQLKLIKTIPDGGMHFLEPSENFQNNFLSPPLKEEVSWNAEKNRYTAAKEKSNVTVPNAFADWPPDDEQPPWNDVTYYRLFNDKGSNGSKFNYTAYNTIRYYDPSLNQAENRVQELWDSITQIIPHYIKTFDIDGVMLDMGHALPIELKQEVVKKARDIKKGFLFWDESFEVKDEHLNLKYDGVIGDLWYQIQQNGGLRKLALGLSLTKASKIPLFGTPETHNSPRFSPGDHKRKKAAWLILNLRLDTLPVIHNGFELNDDLPVNTGLNFKPSLVKKLENKPLALFDISRLNWGYGNSLIEFIQSVNRLKAMHPRLFESTRKVVQIESGNDQVLIFLISNTGTQCYCMLNLNFRKKQNFNCPKEISNTACFFSEKTGSSFDKESILSRGELYFGIKKMA